MFTTKTEIKVSFETLKVLSETDRLADCPCDFSGTEPEET